jgi:hypothetical protein
MPHSSWPGLSRPPKPCLRDVTKKDVGGRDIRAFTPVFDGLLPGHDDVDRSWTSQVVVFPRGAGIRPLYCGQGIGAHRKQKPRRLRRGPGYSA